MENASYWSDPCGGGHPPVFGTCFFSTVTVKCICICCLLVYISGATESLVTAEQMQQAVLPLACRDYCEHEYIRLLRCRRENFPNYWACNEEKHAWQKCGFDEYVLHHDQYELCRPSSHPSILTVYAVVSILTLSYMCSPLHCHPPHSEVMRMKEFEREKRLKMRKQRIEMARSAA